MYRVLPPLPDDPRFGDDDGCVMAGSRLYWASDGAQDGPIMHLADLEAAGWTRVCPSGETHERPARAGERSLIRRGFAFFDVTLETTIIWDGRHWRDPATGKAV